MDKSKGQAGKSVEVKWAQVRSEDPAFVPAQSYQDDAGIDLCISRPVIIHPGAFAQLQTNIAIELPPGAWAMLVGRSSTFYRRCILINTGIIDGGYRGEIVALAYNLGQKRATVRSGERLIQLIIMPRVRCKPWLRKAVLKTSERGAGGLGSTDMGAAALPTR